MHIPLHHDDDLTELDQRIRTEKKAVQRDRLRAVRLALDGLEEPVIRSMIGRSRDFVQKWCYAYRDGGLDAIAPKPRKGRPTKLPRDQEDAFRERMLAGPKESDGVCTLRGKDAVRILEEEFGVEYSLDGVYDLLERLGFSYLKPRPLHRKNDPEAMKQWTDRAPLFVQNVQEQHPEKRVEVWFQDAPGIFSFGHFRGQGTLTNVWALTGSRPEAVKQTEYQWVYLYASVNPITGESSAMLAPHVNTDYMNQHLKFVSQAVDEDVHVVLVLDQAGWHVAKDLVVPENITLLHLPPYSPQLNGVERVWAFQKSHHLSNRLYLDYDDLFDAVSNSWNQLPAERLASLTATPWLTQAL